MASIGFPQIDLQREKLERDLFMASKKTTAKKTAPNKDVSVSKPEKDPAKAPAAPPKTSQNASSAPKAGSPGPPSTAKKDLAAVSTPKSTSSKQAAKKSSAKTAHPDAPEIVKENAPAAAPPSRGKSKSTLTPEEREAEIRRTAYYIAEKTSFTRDPQECWAEAVDQVEQQYPE
jgi:hypothetical protein